MIKSRPLTFWFRLGNDLKTHQPNINDKFVFFWFGFPGARFSQL